MIQSSISIWLPLAEPEGRLTRSVKCSWRSQPAYGWARILEGLKADGATLASGKPIERMNQAVMWVGEQAAQINPELERTIKAYQALH